VTDDKEFGGGGSRSAAVDELSNDFENLKRSIRQKPQKAGVQVQNRYNGSAYVSRLEGLALYLARRPSVAVTTDDTI
jgi:hypothetical protein